MMARIRPTILNDTAQSSMAPVSARVSERRGSVERGAQELVAGQDGYPGGGERRRGCTDLNDGGWPEWPAAADADAEAEANIVLDMVG